MESLPRLARRLPATPAGPVTAVGRADRQRRVLSVVWAGTLSSWSGRWSLHPRGLAVPVSDLVGARVRADVLGERGVAAPISEATEGRHESGGDSLVVGCRGDGRDRIPVSPAGSPGPMLVSKDRSRQGSAEEFGDALLIGGNGEVGKASRELRCVEDVVTAVARQQFLNLSERPDEATSEVEYGQW